MKNLLKKKKPANNRIPLVLAVFLVVVIAAFSPPGRRWLGLRWGTPPKSSPARSLNVHEGDEATISAPGAEGVYLVVEEGDWNTMLDAEVSEDPEELKQLVAEGKVIYEPAGTQVKALKQSARATKVRIRGGKHPGVAAWVQMEYLHPLR